MKTPKTLLLAVSGNEDTKHFTEQGIGLAASLGASLVVVSVVPKFEGNMYLTHLDDHMAAVREPHEKALELVKESAAKANVSCKTFLEMGTPYEVIVDVAEAHDVDWIVLGEMSCSVVGRAFFSTVAKRVIGYSRREVLVVPAGAKIAFDRIQLCLDGSPSSANAMERAVESAKAYAGTILAATVVDVPAEYVVYDKIMSDLMGKAKIILEDVKKVVEAEEVPLEQHIRQGDAAVSLLSIAESESASMIVMGSHGRTGLRRLLMGSVANEMLCSAPVPMLVVP